MAPKLRQIQRFVELLGHLLDESPLRQSQPRDRDATPPASSSIDATAPSPLRVIDMGAGKGYLTFAIAEFFRTRGIRAEVTGVETRPDLVELTNRVAQEHGLSQLNFVCGKIGEFAPPHPPDVLIALHACDTATDDALAQGVRASAALILTAPCCHQEVRSQLQPPPVLCDVLRHGILAAREAEILTDGLRALLLEIHGYRASVFEFISPEETSKNLMLAAVRRDQPIHPAYLREQWRALMAFYGLRDQRLATLLGERL
jgi:SAM-dependent methyltransferase